MEKINTITVNGTTYQIGGSGGSVIETTYAELKSLKDSNGLVPGQQYKLTDYETLIEANDSKYGPSAKVAGHRFDLTLTASTKNSFNAIAKASKRSDDDYFLNSNLDAWVIYYSFDNDSTNYPVNSTCKGYIYRMIDEYNNDVNFDFKNIKIAVSASAVHNISEIYTINETYTYSYFYLFSYVNSTSVEDLNQAQDASMLNLAKNNKVVLTSSFDNFIADNGEGLALVIIKSLLAASSIIENNEISSNSCLIFSYSSLFSVISNNIILNAYFTTNNIAGVVRNNYLSQNSDLSIGIQNWEADNYNHIMGDIRDNYVYPSSNLSCYGSSKNGVSFKNNVIFTSTNSRIVTDYSINNCKIEGKFPVTAVLDSVAENMYLLGNNTDVIRKVAIYDIGL